MKESIAQKKAGRYFAAGAKLAARQKYKKSLERYLCSLKMKAHSNTLFNIAQISKLVENKTPALRLLRKFRNRNPEHPSVPEVNQLIDKMERGEFDTPPNETNSPPTPKETNEINDINDINAAQKTLVPLELIVEEVAPSPVSEAIIASQAPPPQINQKMKTAGIILAATGGTFTVLAIGLSIGAGKNKNKASNATEYDTFDDYESKYVNLSVGAALSYIVGVSCLTTGVILLLRSKKRLDSPAGSFPNTAKFQLHLSGPNLSISF